MTLLKFNFFYRTYTYFHSEWQFQTYMCVGDFRGLCVPAQHIPMYLTRAHDSKTKYCKLFWEIQDLLFCQLCAVFVQVSTGSPQGHVKCSCVVLTFWTLFFCILLILTLGPVFCHSERADKLFGPCAKKLIPWPLFLNITTCQKKMRSHWLWPECVPCMFCNRIVLCELALTKNSCHFFFTFERYRPLGRNNCSCFAAFLALFNFFGPLF